MLTNKIALDGYRDILLAKLKSLDDISRYLAVKLEKEYMNREIEDFNSFYEKILKPLILRRIEVEIGVRNFESILKNANRLENILNSERQNKKTLAVCCIVYNGEKHISNMINSVKDIVDEYIFYIDKRTDDGTVEIINNIIEENKRFIRYFTFENNWGELREGMLEDHHCDWALMLDYDEAILWQEDKDRIKAALYDSNYDTYSLGRIECLDLEGKNIFFRKSIQEIQRIFKKDSGVKFTKGVHETPTKDTIGRNKHLGALFQHFKLALKSKEEIKQELDNYDKHAYTEDLKKINRIYKEVLDV